MNYGRQVGVRVPENQSTEQAPTMTVTRVAPMSLFLVEYGDERGVKHTVIAAVCGDTVYAPPQGELWTAGFKPFVKAIGDQILSMAQDQQADASATPARIDASDDVDVTGSGSLA